MQKISHYEMAYRLILVKQTTMHLIIHLNRTQTKCIKINSYDAILSPFKSI